MRHVIYMKAVRVMSHLCKISSVLVCRCVCERGCRFVCLCLCICGVRARVRVRVRVCVYVHRVDV